MVKFRMLDFQFSQMSQTWVLRVVVRTYHKVLLFSISSKSGEVFTFLFRLQKMGEILLSSLSSPAIVVQILLISPCLFCIIAH